MIEENIKVRQAVTPCCNAYNFCRKKHQSQLRPQSKSTAAEFLDGRAQGIILTVIFQSIDAKFCNRASFRQGVQDLYPLRRQLDRRPREESGSSQLRELARPLQSP